MDTIDLGESPQAPTPELAKTDSSEPIYPTLTLRGGPELHSIPKSGQAIIHHRVIGKHYDEHRGNKSHSIELQVRKIKPMKSKRPSNASDQEAMQNLVDGQA